MSLTGELEALSFLLHLFLPRLLRPLDSPRVALVPPLHALPPLFLEVFPVRVGVPFACPLELERLVLVVLGVVVHRLLDLLDA